MATDSTLSRTLHDVGLATWFGGALMGAVGVNGAAAAIGGRQGARVAERGWSRWAPVQFAAVGAHAAGALGLTWSNRGRLGRQRGVASLATAKALVTAAAVGATAYAAWLGQQTADDPEPPVPPRMPRSGSRRRRGRRQATPGHPAVGRARADRALLVLNAKMGEQQRPQNVVQGVVERFR